MASVLRWAAAVAVVAVCAGGVTADDTLKPTEADVPYGEHPRQKLDFYAATGDGPHPVLICFHGGGYVSGDKSKYASASMVKRCLANGISVVSANYRFVRNRPGEPRAPYPAPMQDGARVVQFVRHQAAAWDIDPERIALTGGSAGGGISLWVALRDEMADPESKDPVARQSTRVVGVLGQATQTTLDPRTILKHIGGNPRIHGVIPDFYDVRSVEDLEKPSARQKIESASAINYVSKGDPPLYLAYSLPLTGTPLKPDTSMGVSIHHPMFGKLMCDRYEKLGLDCTLSARDVEAKESTWAFLERVLKR